MSSESGEKKHYATERRRVKLREQGQVVRSQDLSSAAMLLAALAWLWMLGGNAAQTLCRKRSSNRSRHRHSCLQTPRPLRINCCAATGWPLPQSPSCWP